MIACPADGQQFIDARIGPGREFFEGLPQPGSGVNAVEPGGTDQALNGGSAFSGAFATGEEPVLFPDGNRTNRVLDGVIVDRQMSGSRSYREDATVDALSYNVLLCLGNVP